MKDPYVVLGVSPDASDEEIKRAYRELARKYHPDNYTGNALEDLAQEKMQEINEAYDVVQEQRRVGGGSAAFGQVRAAIERGDIDLAQELLEKMSTRSAEWHFLMGSVHYRKGWFDEAVRHMQTACSLEPGNQEYATAYNRMRTNSQWRHGPGQPGDTSYRRGFGNGYDNGPGYGNGGGMSCCDCCTTMLCANCLSECLCGNGCC